MPVVVVQELGLVRRHVHVDRALGRAGLAGQAQVEGPVNVDMATYKAEFLHHHYRHGLSSFLGRNRRPMAHFTMGWMPLLMRIVEKVPLSFRLINLLESHRGVEELTKRLGGIEPRRRMITFAEQPLTRWFRGRPAARSGGGPAETRPSVVLWPDTFTNFSADAPGRAAVEVLEAWATGC